MSLTLTISLSLLFAAASTMNPLQRNPRIFGGTDANIDNAPWQISLQFKGEHTCGGSIITRRFIITAAHCVVDGTDKDYKIRGGSAEHAKGGFLISVTKRIPHPSYTTKSFSNDIALVQLKLPIIFVKGIAPVKLATRNPLSQTSVTVTGWGHSRPNTTSSKNLQIAELNIIPRSVCRLLFLEISDDMICAGSPRSSACTGDSGGPLMFDDFLVGVATHGYSFCQGPTVFSNVAKHNEWIMKTIEGSKA